MPKLVNNLNSFYYPQGLSGLGIDSLDGYPISEPPAPTLGAITPSASKVETGLHYWAAVWKTEYGMSVAGAPVSTTLGASSTVVVNQPTLPPAGAIGWYIVRTKATGTGTPGTATNPFFFVSTTVTAIATTTITDATPDASLSTRQPPAIANGYVADPGLKTNPTIMPDRGIKVSGQGANTNVTASGYVANQWIDVVAVVSAPGASATSTFNVVNSMIQSNSVVELLGFFTADATAGAILAGNCTAVVSGMATFKWKNVGGTLGVGQYYAWIRITSFAL